MPQLLDMGLRPEYLILLAHPQNGSIDGLLRRLHESGYQTEARHSSDTHPRFLCRRVGTDC